MPVELLPPVEPVEPLPVLPKLLLPPPVEPLPPVAPPGLLVPVEPVELPPVGAPIAPLPVFVDVLLSLRLVPAALADEDGVVPNSDLLFCPDFAESDCLFCLFS